MVRNLPTVLLNPQASDDWPCIGTYLEYQQHKAALLYANRVHSQNGNYRDICCALLVHKNVGSRGYWRQQDVGRVLSADDGIEAGKDTVKDIVGGEVMRQGEESLESRERALAQSSTSCNPSPPVSSVHKTMTKISSRLCFFVRAMQGAFQIWKYLTTDAFTGTAMGYAPPAEEVLVRSRA